MYIDYNWAPLCFHSNWCGPLCSTCSSWVWWLWTSLLLLATIIKARTTAGTMTSFTWQRWEFYFLIFSCFFLQFQMSSLKLPTVRHHKIIWIEWMWSLFMLMLWCIVVWICIFILLICSFYFIILTSTHTQVTQCVSVCHVGVFDAISMQVVKRGVRPPSPPPSYLSLSHTQLKRGDKKREKNYTQYYLSPQPPPISYTHRSADLFQSVWRLWGEYRKWRHWV